MPGRDLPDLEEQLRRLPTALAVEAPAGLAERVTRGGRAGGCSGSPPRSWPPWSPGRSSPARWSWTIPRPRC